MDITKVVTALKDNNVPVSKNYVHVFQDGAIKEYIEHLNNLTKEVEKLCVYGINNGFSAPLKAQITQVTDLCVKIVQQKNLKKYDKITQECSKLLKDSEKIMKNTKNTINTLDEVKQYVATYKQAVVTLIKMDSAESRKVHLVDSATKLKELEEILANVVDVSSEKSAEVAKSIVATLKEFSNVVSVSMYDSHTPLMLEPAIESAKKWTTLTNATSTGLFKKGKKATSLDGIEFVKDDMFMIAKSEAVCEQINTFGDLLVEYTQDALGGKFDTTHEVAEREAKRNELEELNAQKASVVAKFKNGEIDKFDLVERCKDIDYNAGEVERDIQDLSNIINRNEQRSRNFKRVVKKLERINRLVLSYKNEPIMLSYLGGFFNFASAVKVMRGTATKEDMENIINFNATAIDISNTTDAKIIRLFNDLNKSEEEIYEDNQSNVQKTKRTERKLSDEDEEYLKSLLGEEKVEKPVEQKSETVNLEDLL